MPNRMKKTFRRAMVEALEERRLLAFNPLDPTFGSGGIVTVPGATSIGSLNPPTTGLSVLYNGNTFASFNFSEQVGSGQSAVTRYYSMIEEFSPTGALLATAPFAASANPSLLRVCTAITILGTNVGFIATGTEAFLGQTGGYLAQEYTYSLMPVGPLVEGATGQKLLAVDSIGRLLLDDSTGQGHSIQRVNSDGTPDPTFNAGQPIAVDFVPDTAALSSEGNIVVAGGGTFVGSSPAIELLELNPDGSPDTTFGVAGIVRAALGFNVAANAPTVQSLAASPISIFVAGQTPTQFQVASFDEAGHFDGSFSDSGSVLGLPDSGTGLVASPGYDIFVARRIGNTSQVAVSRFSPDGSPDVSFNDGSPVVISVPGESLAATIDFNGQIVIAGVDTIVRIAAKPPAPSTGMSQAIFSGVVTAEDVFGVQTPVPGARVDLREVIDDPLGEHHYHQVTRTDSSGHYQFTLDPVGQYSITVKPRRGLRVLAPAAGSYQPSVVAGALVTYGNFVLVGAGTISGRVYDDINNDGKPEVSEPTDFANALVYLDLNHDGKFDAGDDPWTPEGNAPYTFANLPAGAYQVRAQPNPGYRITGSRSHTIHLGQTLTAQGVNFGIAPIGDKLSGIVFGDRNSDGIRNAGDPPLAGWTVIAQAINGPSDNPFPVVRATTDAHGRYSMTLTHGVEYSVGVIPSGLFTSPVQIQQVNAARTHILNFPGPLGPAL